MIDASRDHAPDIPSLSGKDLYLLVVRMGWMTNEQIETFRNQQQPHLRGANIIDFVNSSFFRSHLDDMLSIKDRAGMLPHLMHAAVLAERRRAVKIDARASETNDSLTAMLAEVNG